MKQTTGLILFTVFLILVSGTYVNSKDVEDVFNAKGHVLDCENYSNLCVDEATFNALYKEYSASQKAKKKEEDDSTLVDFCLKKEKAKLEKEAKSRRMASLAFRKGSDEAKFEEEVEHEQENIDDEVDQAMQKVKENTEHLDDSKVEEVASRIRRKITEQAYEKAANKLHLNASEMKKKINKFARKLSAVKDEKKDDEKKEEEKKTETKKTETKKTEAKKTEAKKEEKPKMVTNSDGIVLSAGQNTECSKFEIKKPEKLYNFCVKKEGVFYCPDCDDKKCKSQCPSEYDKNYKPKL